MKRLLLLFSFITLFVTCTCAQELNIPQNYRLKTRDDFKQYEPDIINCINWLTVPPRIQDSQKRQQAEDFVVDWIYKCPYITVIMEQYVMKISARNPDLVLSFMFGYTLYKLQHPEEKSLLVLNIAGLTRLLTDYKQGSQLFKQDDDLDELIELEKNQKLPEWIKPQLSQSRVN